MGRIGELRWGTVGDVALVGFIVAATLLAVFTAHNPVSTHVAGPRWLAISFALVIALPLFWRRSRPLLVCAVIAAGIVAQALASENTPEGLQLIVLWIVVPYSVAYYADRSEALIGLGILLAAFVVYAAENTDITSGQAGNEWSGAFFLVLALGSWLTGSVLRARREAAALTASANELRRDAQLATAEERSRIARELHDIVAHNLSVVVLQAAGARAQADPRAQTSRHSRRSSAAVVKRWPRCDDLWASYEKTTPLAWSLSRIPGWGNCPDSSLACAPPVLMSNCSVIPGRPTCHLRLTCLPTESSRRR